MIQLFCKKKGAISVFLSVILMPMLIVAFLATDAARIYSAKVVISDAGELAMNAALAQYNAELKDEYGLIAMDKVPSSMQGELEKYFNASLNSDDSGGYSRILDLVEQDFAALDIEASKLYKTEVEKQQILEYMKYRAPVCMAEMVLEKLEQIKENKKMLEAMEAEADFAEAMQEVQDAFEDAKVALDNLNSIIESFPNQNTIEKELEATQQDFTVPMATAFLMRAAISYYDDYDAGKINSADDTQQKLDALSSVARSFINQAGYVSMNNVLDGKNYDYYIDALYYKNTVDKFGGIGKLTSWYDELHPADSDENPPDPDTRQGLVDLQTEYNNKKDAISQYSNKLLGIANDYVKTHANTLNSWYNMAKEGASSAKDACTKLDTVVSKIKEAARLHAIWEEKTNQLSNPGSMKEELEKYDDMFDTQKCEELMYNVDTDQKYFNEIRDILTEEQFYGQSIATVSAASQSNKYNNEASYVMKGRENYYYINLDSIRVQTYITDYHHTKITTANRLVHIETDPFYQQLIKYCQSNESAEKNEQKKTANGKLEEGADGADEAKSTDGYPTYDWSSAGVALPSTLLGVGSIGANTDSLTGTTGGDIDNKSDRKNIIAKVRESIKEANSFLDGLDRILSDGVENLYIAEYGMQMFTYYTVDKKVDASHTLITLSGEDLTSLSGYKFTSSNHKAFKAETEYILWGKASSAKNVQTTVAVIYGIRLLFNAFFALTNADIDFDATKIAAPWASVAPYLEPIIRLVFKFGLALCETVSDVQKIKEGWGVAVIKDKNTWVSWPVGGLNPDNTRGTFTLDYSEYLRIFINTKMAVNETGVLARIGDCVQVNTGSDIDITKMYTMLSIEASVSNRTTFMRKIADWSGAGWEYDDAYTIDYKSVLGY